MKTASHTFNTVHGVVTISLDIFTMDAIEAIDVYELDSRFRSGGYRIEGTINATPRGTLYYPHGILGGAYFGDGTEDVAREFLAAAHRDGVLYRLQNNCKNC